MHATTFDTFKFIRRLKETGIPENQAEAISDAIQDAHSTQLADLATKRDIETLDTKIDTKLKELEYRMTIRLGLMMMAMFGMFFAALRYFPPPVQAHYQPTQETRVPAPVPPAPPISQPERTSP